MYSPHGCVADRLLLFTLIYTLQYVFHIVYTFAVADVVANIVVVTDPFLRS